MVVGLPNLGKSSLVNRVTGRARAHTGNRPGITVGEQWIEARPGLRLLDEPGLLPFRPGPVVDALGSVPEGRSDVPAILTCLLSVPILRQRLCAWVGWTDGGGPEVPEVPLEPDTPGAPDALPADAGRDPGPRGSWEPDGERLLRAVAHRIGALGPKGRPDLERASRHVIGLFRDGGLGRISLERPDDPAGGADRSMTLRDGLA